MGKEYTPRLSIDITAKQHAKLINLIPWGVKNIIFRVIIDDLISLIEEFGPIILATLMEKRLTLKDLPTLKPVTKKKKRTTKNGNA